MSIIVMLVGPIAYWWDENYDTPEAQAYRAWRQYVSDILVINGLLVYRPHEAFKGAWDDRGQVVNDAILKACDIIVDLSPPDVPSPGTDSELKMARLLNKRIIKAPPTDDINVVMAITHLLDSIHRTEVANHA